MSWKFRKRIKIAPGVNVNLSRKSAGMSVGNRFARRSLSTSGRKTTSFSLPGSGLTHVSSSGGGRTNAQPQAERRSCMSYSTCGLIGAIALLAGVTLAFFALLTGPTTASAQADCQPFSETGKTICGKFLAYWQKNGGLAQQGYPLTGTFNEVSDTDGKTYIVQYFERAVFEYHPETAPNDVLLSLLGTFLYNQKYPSGAPNQTPNNEAGSVLFPETNKRVGGLFLDYWNSHGGLAQQGFPISDEFMEVSDLNGQTYKVQYFQRAVFEYHPEEQPPFNVLLSQLGTFQFKKKYPSGEPATSQPLPTSSVPTPAPSGPYAATASVDNPTPEQKTNVRVTGVLMRGGQPVRDAVMNTSWKYKSTTTPCNGAKTNSEGVAGCSNNIGNATPGFTVVITVTFVVDGSEVASTQTSFTPR
jgi:hypothetical protein